MWGRKSLQCGSIILLWLITGTAGCNLKVSSHVVPNAWYEEDYAGGVYTGRQGPPTPQLIVVDITIEEGRIVAIRLREHPAWKRPEEQEKLLRAVIAGQTVAIPTPREEGSEQDRLLDAIEDALNKARRDIPSVP